MERVSSFKFLDVYISDDLTWSLNTTQLVKNTTAMGRKRLQRVVKTAERTPPTPNTDCSHICPLVEGLHKNTQILHFARSRPCTRLLSEKGTYSPDVVQ
ncbi:unnamed protein product [Pleuronectes platessa]|uniref:Uncharacterized protein n=1 Tax=Pleuronectes platessa TaxID=8262 RepID=A0A9N7U5A2_PLEPL|nr:unnamed protein product [Pleuronectes platessa]